MSIQRVFDWTLNLLLWGGIAFVTSAYTVPFTSGAQLGGIIGTCLIGLIYYLNAFCSSYIDYFLHQTDVAKIYEEIDKIFKSPPMIVMNIECYHYVTRTVHSRSRKGGSRTRTVRRRVVTHRANQEFTYRSWRDISGIFQLDTSQAAEDENLAYVKLALDKKVSFANDGSGEDFAQARDLFKALNRRDLYQRYWESFNIDGFSNNFMVQVTDVVPCCFGLGYFIWWSLIGFHLFYVLYVDNFCHEQEFTIKKVVSTRQDLRNEEINRRYEYYNPRMIMKNQTIVFGKAQPQFLSLPPQGIPQQPPEGVLFVPANLLTEQPQEVDDGAEPAPADSPSKDCSQVIPVIDPSHPSPSYPEGTQNQYNVQAESQQQVLAEVQIVKPNET
eukprot:TRINITY_DN1812_c0_g1_i1.p1 TRINITY_DN1812_c0_g1~~TRINITY_DN1812_c0_g1_i1.p1  ORF type:complete len:426 (-),score=15.19 TRINITY_DN1812_c0_g1_i1:112-1266(-)